MNPETPLSTSRFADLLEPVAADAPCGADLEYDPAFVMLQAAAAPRVEAQYGDFVDVPAPANWAEIERGCRALLLRTKDIRVAVMLLRCRVRLDGARGLDDALTFLNALLACYGEALHPLPVADGEPDPLAFANAIAALTDPDGTLADLREIVLPKAASLKLQLRDVEKALATPRLKDALAPESVTRALRESWSRREPTLVALVAAHRQLEMLVAWCDATLGEQAPEFGALERLLQPFSPQRLDGGGTTAPDASPGVADARYAGTPAAAHAGGGDPAGEAPPVAANAAAATAPAPAVSAESAARCVDRWSALATLRDTRQWFEHNEPSSPVIVLLRQAERMVGKRFSELAHVIPAELLAQWDAIDDE